MSDPMTPEVRDWMKRTDVEPPDANESARQVRVRLPGVRQRRRWWPFPVFYRKPETPPTEQSTSASATNGQTPTVIGRTTSMLSPVKAITAGAIVFALGSAFLIAQPFEQSSTVPGAEVDQATTEPRPPVIVTGSQLGVGEPAQEPVETVVDGVSQGRGTVILGDKFEADDPRLTGDVSQTVNGDLRTVGSTPAFLITPAMRIENDEGAWSGQCHLLVIADGDPDPFSCLFSGENAYDGLSAYLVFENPEQPPNPFKGLIFEGDLPPFPELPSAE